MRVFDIKALEQGPEKFNKNIADAGRFNDFDGASEICGQGKFKSADGYASMDKFNGVNVADSADKDGAAKFNAAGKICGGAVEFGGTTGLESIAELSDVAEPKGAAEFDSADKFKDGRSAGSDGSSLAYGACRGEDKFKNMDGSSPAHGARVQVSAAARINLTMQAARANLITPAARAARRAPVIAQLRIVPRA